MFDESDRLLLTLNVVILREGKKEGLRWWGVKVTTVICRKV